MCVFLPERMDGVDVGMVEGRSRGGLAAETFQCLRVLRYIVGEKFKGDKSAKGDVLGLVNHAHAAAAEFLDDAVVRDGAPDHACPIIFLRSLFEDHWWQILRGRKGQVSERRGVWHAKARGSELSGPQ